ncbi:MAG: (d)CMP kinase [Duncaniella sp.]|nr:(d)CMP kinase [Duncaniella sp.]
MSSDKKIIIAIDGYSSSGNRPMPRHLAAAMGYGYIDSGAMYRAVTLWAMRAGLIGDDLAPDADALVSRLGEISIDFSVNPDGTQHTMLNGEDVESAIRTLEVSDRVSPVAAIGGVRKALTSMQRAMGVEKGIVMDGRDIGTAVFPQAELKVFVDASAECRAERRYKELKAKGEDVTYEEVLNNVRTRDRIDETREESPLRKAADAVSLDNSAMSTDEQNEILLGLYEKAIRNS